MSYLLDTNVISEFTKAEPNKEVLSWLKSIEMNQFFLSVLTLGEIRKGIEKPPDSKGCQRLTYWLEVEPPKSFFGRIIPVNDDVAHKWGYLCAQYNLHVIDGLLAASALVHNHKIVTRNIKDFINIIGLELVNPFCCLTGHAE